MRKKWTVGIVLVVIVLTTAFIFSNSLKDSQASHAQSDIVVEAVKPIIQPIIDPQTRLTPSDYDYIVRKSAHFCEYALLGMECAILYLLLFGARVSGKGLGLGLYPALAAACDEFIQSFSDRTSMLGDVLLDISGAVCAMAIVAGLAAAFARRGRSRPKT